MRIFFAFFILGVPAACARLPGTPVEPMSVAHVVVVPVALIDKMHAENKGIPLGVLWQPVADRIKSSDFNERTETARKDMGPKLTAALGRQLTAKGYEVGMYSVRFSKDYVPR